MAVRLAVLSGATGFLGRHVARALVADGWRLRVLARRALQDTLWTALGAEVSVGHLGDRDALDRLCEGAELIVHAAGLVKARRAADFEHVNAQGAGHMASAARNTAPGATFILISSLAARAPQLSAYAHSKHAGELAANAALGGEALIVRLPALYGPEDPHTLGLFRAAQASPWLPVLGRDVRLPLLHVEDAARTIVVLASSPRPGDTVALCDGRLQGYTLAEIMTATAEAVGKRARLIQAPEALLRAAGLGGDLACRLGAASLVTSGKVRELLHADWSVAQDDRTLSLSVPRYALSEGFRHTAAWYVAAGWLPAGPGVM